MTSLLFTVLRYLLMSIPVGFILKFQSSGSVVADISPPLVDERANQSLIISQFDC